MPASHSREASDGVVSAVREITHIEGKKEKLPLSLGIRDSRMDIMLKVDTKEKQEKSAYISAHNTAKR